MNAAAATDTTDATAIAADAAAAAAAADASTAAATTDADAAAAPANPGALVLTTKRFIRRLRDVSRLGFADRVSFSLSWFGDVADPMTMIGMSYSA